MTLDRLADHLVHALAWRASHAVPPWAAALILAAVALWLVAKRRRRP